MKATKQRKTSSRKERVASPSTPPEAQADDAQPIAAESDKKAALDAQPTSSDAPGPDPQLGLVICPQCGQRALFWNRRDRIYRCVNPECKREFTLEEYKNKGIVRPPEEQQTEQILSNEPITEVKTEMEPGETDQGPSNESITEAADKIEPGATEQVPSNESITQVADKIEPNATEQILSNESTAEVKDEVKEEAKAGKQISRNLAFLLISLLAIGIVVMGVFLGQKSGSLDELSSKLDKSRQALTQSQTELAASQQNVEGLRTQLAETQQEVEALQAEINKLKPLTPSGPFVYSGELAVGNQISIPIELKASERVEGTIAGGLGGLAFSIQDSGGGIVKDLGLILRSSFIFTAQTSGRYNIVIKGPNELTGKYNLEYTIYRRQ